MKNAEWKSAKPEGYLTVCNNVNNAFVTYFVAGTKEKLIKRLMKYERG